MPKKKCYFILLLVLGIRLNGQDIKQDLMLLQQAYKSAEHLQLKLNLNGTDAKGNPISLGTASMSKAKENYHSKALNDEMIANEQGTLIIDHEEKSINFFPSKKEEFNAVELDLEDLLASSDSIVYLGVNKQGKGYVFYHANSMIPKTEIRIDQEKHWLTKITYQYYTSGEWASPWKSMEITYSTSTNKSPTAAAFSFLTVIKQEGEEWMPTKKYANYHLKVIADDTHSMTIR